MDAFIDLFINYPGLSFLYVAGAIFVVVFAISFIEAAIKNPDGGPRR